jgi:hypothetical protein
MRKNIVATLLTCSLGLEFAQAQTATSASVTPKKPRRDLHSTSDQIIHGADEATKKSDHDLLVMITGFRFLLKNEGPGAKRDGLLLADSSAALALARNFRLRPKPTDKDRASEKKYLEMALGDASEIAKSPTANDNNRSRGLYYSGLSLIDLGRGKEAEQIFTEAIKVKPNAEYAPAMSLYLGESKFDQEKYQDAIPLYSQFFKRFNKSQQSLAIYKTAWCYVNLQKPDMAEKNFLLLAGKKWAAAFGQDAIADLAFVMVDHRKEDEILQYTATLFPAESEIRTQILTAVYKYYLSSSGTHSHPALFAELMRIEKDPAKRLLLVITNLKGEQRTYASLIPYSQFQDLKHRMTEERVTPGSEVMKKIGSELEPQVEQLIKAFSDTFSGKTKTAEKIDRAEMSKILIDLLKFHTSYFPNSQDRSASYDTWLEVCRDLKDLDCSYQVSRQVMKDKSLEKLHAKAKIEWLNALNGLKDKNPSYRTEYLNGLKAFNKEMPNDPEWLPLTKRLTALLNEDKNFVESLPILKQIDQKEHSTESRYRLLWAMFESQQFEDVTTLGASGGDKFAEDSKKLVREAHLRIASQKIEKNDFAGYEKHVNDYIKDNGDAAKTELVRRDYLSRSLERGDASRVDQYLIALPPEKRFSKDNKALTTRLLDRYIRTGEFESAHKILSKGAKFGQFKEFEFDWLQTSIGLNRAPTRTDLQSIKDADPKVRSYVLGVLTLTHPEAAMTYFQMQTSLSVADKHTLLLAYQVAGQTWTPKLGPKARAMLGNVALTEAKDPESTRSEKEIAAIHIPKDKVSEKRVAKLAEETRQTRKHITKDLEGKSQKVQKRILTAAQTLEENIAKIISESPIPPNLSEEQQAQYKAGVQDLANEFTNQATEYKKLSDVIEQKVDAEDKERQRRIAKINPAGEVSDSETKKVVEKLMNEKNFGGSIVVIDRANALGLVKTEEFHILRAWILLTEHPTDFMKEYVRGELIEAKQDRLLDKWEAK